MLCSLHPSGDGKAICYLMSGYLLTRVDTSR